MMVAAPEHAEQSEQLNAYIDGELSAVERAAFERHLRSCALCQLELDQLGAARSALQVLPLLRAPRPMTITAPAPAEQPGWLVRWLPWVWRAGSLGAAACLLIGAITAALPLAPTATLSSRSASAPAAQERAPQAPAAGAVTSGSAPASQVPQSGGFAGAPPGNGVAGGDAGQSQGLAPRQAPQPPPSAAQNAARAAQSSQDTAAPAAKQAQSPAPTPGAASRGTRRYGALGWLVSGIGLAIASVGVFAYDRRRAAGQ